MAPGFLLRMAWREMRAAPQRLLLLVAAIGVGVGALVAINSFTDNLQDSVRSEAKALLGADLALSGRSAFSPRVRALIDTLSGADAARRARLVTFAAMAYVPRTSGTRLVQVSAVEGGYPFYGRIETDPASAWGALQDDRRVLVDPSLLLALSAQVGDTLALGEGRFVISGTVLNAPGDVGIRTAFGARIFIPARYLDDTKLLGFGARAQYETFIQLAGQDADRVAERYRQPLRDERVRIRTVADDQENLTRTLGQLSRYLGLVALVALLLGGLGVGSASYSFIRQRLDAIAIMRCLGASAAQVFAIYLLQALLLGAGGSVLGAALGVAVQQLLPGVLGDLLPVQVATPPSPPAILLGVGTGVWVAFAFALLPLLTVRRVSPLAALRRDVEPAGLGRDPLRVPALAFVALSVVALAARQVESWRNGAVFSAGIAAALLVLWVAARLLMRGVRRWFPSAWPYVWRQGLANLYRPANQTVTVVLALGFGAFLLCTLFLVQHNLLDRLRVDSSAERPNLVLVDIQTDQRTGIDSLLRATGAPVSGAVPIVPMRILAVKGTPVRELLKDDGARLEAEDAEAGERRGRRNLWAFRREYRSTYRDTLVRSEKVVLGQWWQEGGTATGTPSRRPVASPPVAPSPVTPPLDTAHAISIEKEVAAELGVGLGDEITWDIQGAPVRTTITSVREVDWARFEPNFFVVFAPGALEQAPQSQVQLTRLDDPAVRGQFQRRLAERFPNVTTVDLSLVQQAVEGLVDRVVLAIRFMALFSLVTGGIVLLGAVAASRSQREREGALLKTLGASRRQVLRVALAEYASIGLLAATTALALAAGAGWALASFVFEVPFRLPVPALAALALGMAVLTVLIGLASSLDVARKTPLAVLRGE